MKSCPQCHKPMPAAQVRCSSCGATSVPSGSSTDIPPDIEGCAIAFRKLFLFGFLIFLWMLTACSLLLFLTAITGTELSYSADSNGYTAAASVLSLILVILVRKASFKEFMAFSCIVVLFGAAGYAIHDSASRKATDERIKARRIEDENRINEAIQKTEEDLNRLRKSRVQAQESPMANEYKDSSSGMRSRESSAPSTSGLQVKSFRWTSRVDTELGTAFWLELESVGAIKLELIKNGSTPFDTFNIAPNTNKWVQTIFVGRKVIFTMRASNLAGDVVSTDIELAPNPSIATNPERMILGEPLNDWIDVISAQYANLDFRSLTPYDANPLKAWVGERLEVVARNKEMLRIVRNLLFAKHGYRFKDDTLIRIFSGRAWYRPTTSDPKVIDSMVTPQEKANLEFIQELERAG